MRPQTKPYHLMTPAERLAQRIAENRKIDEKVAETKHLQKIRDDVYRAESGAKAVRFLNKHAAPMIAEFCQVSPRAAVSLFGPVTFRRMTN